MKINYFELKVVDSGTNLPELKHFHRNDKLMPILTSIRPPSLYDSVGFASFPERMVPMFFATCHSAQCVCGRCCLPVNRKQMGRLAQDRHKKHKN